MKRTFKSKKAVAPLIATVLLIAFAVALGAIVMNWGRAYVEDTADMAKKSSTGQVECANDVDLQINKILYDNPNTEEGVDSLEDTGLGIVVENLKTKEILGLSIKVMDENGNGFVTPMVDDLNELKDGNDASNLGSFQIRTVDINYTLFEDFRVDMSSGYEPKKLKEIRVIPYILPDNDEEMDVIACDGRAITTRYGGDAWPDYEINFTS